MVGIPAAFAAARVSAGLPDRLRKRFEKSTFPIRRPIGGIRMSLVNDATILPNAAPMMTPTARSSTLPLLMNSLNSLSMEISLSRFHVELDLSPTALRQHPSSARGRLRAQAFGTKRRWPSRSGALTAPCTSCGVVFEQLRESAQVGNISTPMRTCWNRRTRAGPGRRPIGAGRRLHHATFSAMGWCHVITRPPAAVVGPVRLVDASDISPAAYCAGRQHREQQDPQRLSLIHI